MQNIGLLTLFLLIVLLVGVRHIAVSYLLHRWGKSERARVLTSVRDAADGVLYHVSYEFSASQPSGGASVYSGKQAMRFKMEPKDIVAVRYWPLNPRVSRLTEREI